MVERRRNQVELFQSLKQEKTSETSRKDQYRNLVSNFYTLATDFFEFGWGQSFHFANRYATETLAESLQRHESFLALKMNPKAGEKILDIGCGVGGPLRRIAYLTNAHITGISICPYQIQRAKSIGIPTNCAFIEGDFLQLPFEDNSFDHVYVIEAICHSPSKIRCCAEVHRVLKPGGSFVGYDCCLTDRFDSKNVEHEKLKNLLERTSALPELQTTNQLIVDLKSVGFTIEESRDLPSADIPWFSPLENSNSYFSLKHFRTCRWGRWLTRSFVWALEKLRLASDGSVATLDILEETAQVMIRGGQSEIFTPYFFFYARKAH